MITKNIIKFVLSGIICAATLSACSQNNSGGTIAETVKGTEKMSETQTAEAADEETTAKTSDTTEEESMEPASDETISSDLNVETVSASIQGTIHVEKLSTGAIAYVYVPENESYGMRATSSPILVTYGDVPYTAESALETAYASGLAAIADMEQGAVVFVNPLGKAWGEDDVNSLEAAKNLFSDATNNNQKVSDYRVSGKSNMAAYPGTYSRLYVFGEGSGADFAYEYLSPGVDGSGQFFGNAVIKPTAIFLCNPESQSEIDLTASDGREIPAAIVNGSDTIIASYEKLNQTEPTLNLNSETDTGFDAKALTEAYDQVLEHYMVRIQSSLGLEDCKTTLQKICGNEELGLVEEKRESTFDDGASLTYYQWAAGEENKPLMVTFHGSGNSAEMQVWATGLHHLASSEGFNLVSFENYSNENIDDAKIIEAIDQVIADLKCDTSRVYISGFSMGSMRSWMLSSQYTDKFAGVIAMNGFTEGMSENEQFDCEIPFYIIGGKDSFMAASLEFPSKDNFIQEAAILKANSVVEDFVFDESAGVWGITPDNTYTVTAQDLPDLALEVSEFASKDGSVLTAFVSASSAGHEPLRVATVDGWKFISKFSRSTDGTIVNNNK